jgi:hypothetical protein
VVRSARKASLLGGDRLNFDLEVESTSSSAPRTSESAERSRTMAAST